MNQKTLTALKKCIDKYERLAAASNEKLKAASFDGTACAVCAIYSKNGAITCGACPVAKAASNGCVGTPWWGLSTSNSACSDKTLVELSYIVHEVTLTETAAILRHMRVRCRAEVKFLKSLLPDD